MSKEDNSFTQAEWQIIEKIVISYENVLLDWPHQTCADFIRAFELAETKERLFLEELRREASLYVERTKINE